MRISIDIQLKIDSLNWKGLLQYLHVMNMLELLLCKLHDRQYPHYSSDFGDRWLIMIGGPIDDKLHSSVPLLMPSLFLRL